MNSEQALKQLQQAQGTQRSATDLYGQQSKQLGLPAAQQRQQELRQTIRGTEQALRGVESSVSGRTQGSLVTEAQRGRLAALERAPIAEQFGEQQRALTDEDALYRDLLAQAGQQSGLAYQSQQDKLSQLERQYGFATEREAEAERRRQAEVAQQQWERQFAEDMRQFNAQQSAARAQTSDISKYLQGLNQPQATNQITADPVAIFREFGG